MLHTSLRARRPSLLQPFFSIPGVVAVVDSAVAGAIVGIAALGLGLGTGGSLALGGIGFVSRWPGSSSGRGARSQRHVEAARRPLPVALLTPAAPYPSAMASRAVSAPLAQLPNALTVLRLALVPLFVIVFVQSDGSSWAAGWIFLVAGVTDQLDGFLARRWHVESRFGKLADPLADRLMLDAAAILLWLDDKLPWYGALIIVLRDVILVGGYRLLMPKGVELSVSTLGKAATWVLYLSLGILLVVGHSTEWPLWLFWIGLGMALVAAAQYVVKARREVAA